MSSTSFKASDVKTGAAHLADAVADISDQATDQAQKTAQRASETIRDASGYLRDKGGDVGTEIKRYIKANPTQALLGAVALGFIIGRLMGRKAL